MTRFPLLIFFFLCVFSAAAQPSYTANDSVSTYTAGFHAGLNNGYYPGFTNEQIAALAAGNPGSIMPGGVGANAMRVGFTEEIAELFGYDILINLFKYYEQLGMGEHTMIVQGPVDWHRDDNFYCPEARSALFKNLYTPIWDNGENATPYNDENYFAAYMFKMVTLYKPYVRFWEIWNEPGFDLTGAVGWLPPNAPNNWWQNDPKPCDYILRAPVQHYIRTLRIAWEVVKTVDPDAYVTCSGLGYPAFLDAVLRQSDNPNGGGITPEFPLKGGAYFDAVGFHSYPHVDGSVRYWDNGCSCMMNTRHSDGAADGSIRSWKGYEAVLKAHGYDGTMFPEKIPVITEGNVPAKSVVWGADPLLGGKELQRNFIIKAIVAFHKNKIVQYDLFQLFNQKNPEEDAQPFEVMGVYEKTTVGELPQRSMEGIAYKTAQAHLFRCQYDATRSAALSLPSNTDGAAFLTPEGKFVYVLWAKTQQDLSENASAIYNFPSTLGLSNLYKRSWNFDVTRESLLIPSVNIVLNSDPVFLSESDTWANNPPLQSPKTDLELSLHANPQNPQAGEIIIIELSVHNSSSLPDTGVQVIDFMNFSKIFLQDRLSYVSHEAPSGSSYDPMTGIWSIPLIQAGGSDTLRLLVRAKHESPYRVFAEIGASQADEDSSPLNGSIHKIPFEDDEIMFLLNSGPPGAELKADLVVEATQFPENITAATPFITRFMLRNNGEQNAASSQLKVFLSKDEQWGADDLELAAQSFSALGSFGYQTVQKTLEIPASALNGAWNLLFYCDFLNETEEFDENNVFVRKIILIGGIEPCSLSAQISNVQCYDAATPNDPTDDQFYADLLVQAAGTCSNAWISADTSGNYGLTLTLGPFAISDGDVLLNLTDAENQDLSLSLTLEAPAPCSVSLTQEIESEQIRVSPNPAVETLTIRSELPYPCRFVLYNVLGVRVLETVVDGQALLDLSGLAAGLYVLEWEGIGRKRVMVIR